MIRLAELVATICWLAMDLCWAHDWINFALGFGLSSFSIHFFCVRYAFDSSCNWQTTSWIAFNLSWLLYEDVLHLSEMKSLMTMIGIVAIISTAITLAAKQPIKRA